MRTFHTGYALIQKAFQTSHCPTHRTAWLKLTFDVTLTAYVTETSGFMYCNSTANITGIFNMINHEMKINYFANLIVPAFTRNYFFRFWFFLAE